MSFPLDKSMTKKLLTKHKMPAKVFVVVSFKKRSGQPGLFSFHKGTTIKTSANIWFFSHWFLVTGLSNENDISDTIVGYRQTID